MCPTYRIAWDSVIPSYLKVFAKDVDSGHTKAVWRGAQGDPANHLVQLLGRGPDGRGPVEMDVRIRAVQDQDLDEFFRGKECTAFWLPEFDTHVDPNIISYCQNRTGRHPEPEDRPETAATVAYEGVWGDANTPTIGSWFETDFYSKRDAELAKRGCRVHRQPPGYDPDSPDGFHPSAENRQNLRRIRPDYYRHKAKTMDPHDVDRLLRCKLTYGRLGVPVHDKFDQVRHVSQEPLDYDPDAVLIIGVDVDLRGAAVFGQRGTFGSWKVLAEVTAQDAPAGEMDVSEFAEAITAVRTQRFPLCKRAIIVMDPAGKNRSSLNRRVNFGTELQAATKITVVPAPSNDPAMRRTALANPLKRPNGLLIDGPTCPRLCTALNGGFHYPKRAGKVSRVAAKNEHAAVAEAAEYMAMGGEGISEHAALVPHMSLGDPAASNVIEVVFD